MHKALQPQFQTSVSITLLLLYEEQRGTDMNLPSKEECEGWSPEQVARFMCQKQMPECAETVNIFKINGHRLLTLSNSDISKFSLVQQPQLQKIVQDINKNEGSILNKLRRLKVKPGPKVPERDYQGEHVDDIERWSDESDEYEEEGGAYEPPPAHRLFTPSSSSPFSRDEYVDRCENRGDPLPRIPRPPAKANKPLPPKPRQPSDEDDYIDPELGEQDDYIEPRENPPLSVNSSPMETLWKLPCDPDVYEVPEENIPTGSRFGLKTPTHIMPPIVRPRLIRPQTPESSQDTYEVCDPDPSPGPKAKRDPPLPPKPLLREKSPKPVTRTKQIKHKEPQSQTLPMINSDPPQPHMPFTADFRRPMIPFPHQQMLNPHRQAELSSIENGLQDMDKESDIYGQPWYASTCDRKAAEEVLIQSNRDGSFLVRNSSGQDVEQPYTLAVLYNGKVYNIPVRFIQATQQYALGREKKGEEHFSSISSIIENHIKNPLVLIDSQSNTRDTTKLQHAVRP
ncbi:unnamed protein product [Arctogadus glacialis]